MIAKTNWTVQRYRYCRKFGGNLVITHTYGTNNDIVYKKVKHDEYTLGFDI